MDAWEILKKTTPMYLSTSKSGSYLEKNGIYISKSGIDNFTCNWALIETNDREVQENMLQQHFNCNGTIISKDENKDSIDSWTRDKDIKYIGKFPLLKKIQENTEYTITENIDINIKRVDTADLFKDFFTIFTKQRNLNQQESIKMFSKDMFGSNYFLYVAYYKSIPAGIVMMIKTEESLMIVDIEVVKEFRNLNILNMFAQKMLSDAIQNKVYNYAALATSEFSYKVAAGYGYVIDQYCHIWQNQIDIKAKV